MNRPGAGRPAGPKKPLTVEAQVISSLYEKSWDLFKFLRIHLLPVETQRAFASQSRGLTILGNDIRGFTINIPKRHKQSDESLVRYNNRYSLAHRPTPTEPKPEAYSLFLEPTIFVVSPQTGELEEVAHKFKWLDEKLVKGTLADPTVPALKTMFYDLNLTNTQLHSYVART